MKISLPGVAALASGRVSMEPCASCGRPTRETSDERHPLRRCWQGEGIAYALCARCLHVAVEEAGRG